MYARFNVEDIFDAMVPLDGGRVREDYKSGEFSADYIREKEEDWTVVNCEPDWDNMFGDGDEDADLCAHHAVHTKECCEG